MGVRVFFARHGETAWSRSRRFTGSRDVPLTGEGRRQSEALGRALETAPLAAVYASPLERARVAAEAIAKPHRLEVRLEPALRELAFGDWEGLTREEVARRFPEAWDTWRTSPARFVTAAGERLADVAARLEPLLASLRQAHAGESIAVVTHAIPVRLLVLAALGLGPDRLWSIDASPAGLTEVEYRDDWVTVHRMNTLAHLDGQAVGA